MGGGLGVVGHVAVLVPVVRRGAVDQFDEADPALGQSAGHQAGPPEPVGLSAFEPVEVQRRIGFPGQVEHVASLGLHVEGGLEASDPGRQFRVESASLEVSPVEGLGQSEFEFPGAGPGRSAIEGGARFAARALADTLGAVP